VDGQDTGRGTGKGGELMKPYYEHAGITIFCGDCREILPSLPKCGLLLTDPPYGIGEADGKNKGFTYLTPLERND